MPFLLLGFAALVILVLVSRAFSRMKTAEAARWSRILMGLAAAILGGLLTLRGLAILGAPLATFGIGLMAVGAGFRPKPSRENPSSSPGSQSISREEALDILGLDAKPTNEEIRAAYRNRIVASHPDTGGDTASATRLAAARDLLLADLAARSRG